MPNSEARILTTHAGSLPRPPELTRLFARRSRGETVDEEALASAGRDAVAWVVTKQREIGSLEKGKFADVIAVSGNPTVDVTEMERVKFVMKGGAVIRNDFVAPR